MGAGAWVSGIRCQCWWPQAHLPQSDVAKPYKSLLPLSHCRNRPRGELKGLQVPLGRGTMGQTSGYRPVQ
eukprot:1343297-Amorphochlora_amoeboformis.AAC.1